MCSSFNIYIEFLQLDIGELPIPYGYLKPLSPDERIKKILQFSPKVFLSNLFIEVLHGEKIHKKCIVILKSKEEKEVT